MSRFIPLLSVLASLGFAPAWGACPRLEGEYWCMIGRDQLDVLKMGHRVRDDGVHVYSVEYRSIPGEPDYIYANARGVPDGDGWITKCTRDNHLVSIRFDGRGKGEIYLDHEGKFVRLYNDRIVQECPRKTSARPPRGLPRSRTRH